MQYQFGPGPLKTDYDTDIAKAKGTVGIVEDGNVATHAIPKGYYVIWKGDLYVAKSDISSGTTLSSSNLQAKSNGLGADILALKDDLSAFKATQIPNDTDLDTILTPGRYYTTNAAATNSLVHSPIRGTGFTMCVYYKGGQAVQVIFSGQQTCSRGRFSGGWDPWSYFDMNNHIQYGEVSCPELPANTQVEIQVTYPEAYNNQAFVHLTPKMWGGADTILWVLRNNTVSGFTIRVKASSKIEAGDAKFVWLAHGT